MQRRCPSCGGSVQYAPSDHPKMQCIQCGHEQEIEALTPIELDTSWEDVASIMEQQPYRYADDHQKRAYKCESCGGVSENTERTLSRFCSYCGSPYVVEQLQKEGIFHPRYTLPFRVSASEALKRFNKWIRTRWFVPNKFKRADIVANVLNGNYYPCYKFGVLLEAQYRGERGRQVKIQRGNKEFYEIEWERVAGSVNTDFEIDYIQADDSIRNILDQSWWRRDATYAYQEDFHIGYSTDLPTESIESYYEAVTDQRDRILKQQVKAQIGGDRQRIHGIQVTFEERNVMSLFVPVWVSFYEYNTRTYYFIVNGYTGEVKGKFPISWVKVVGAIMLSLVILWCFIKLTAWWMMQ